MPGVACNGHSEPTIFSMSIPRSFRWRIVTSVRPGTMPSPAWGSTAAITIPGQPIAFEQRPRRGSSPAGCDGRNSKRHGSVYTGAPQRHRWGATERKVDYQSAESQAIQLQNQANYLAQRLKDVADKLQ